MDASVMVYQAGMATPRRRSRSKGPRYMAPPQSIRTVVTLDSLVSDIRQIPAKQQERLWVGAKDHHNGAPNLFLAGDSTLLRRPCVAIVGTRQVSREGAARARRLAREVVGNGVVVMSGLAKGVDTEALTEALEQGGRVVAVIGTPLDKAYPAENSQLQERIYREHLLVSPFEEGSVVQKRFFPHRNKVMAALSDATVIIEATDTSGTLHQAVECTRLGRWLFVAKSLRDDPKVTWPRSFEKYAKMRWLSETEDLLSALRETRAWQLRPAATA